MRRRAGFALALASLAIGCGSGASNVSNARAKAPPVEVSLRIQNGECRATLAGEPGDGEALLARGVRVLEDFVRVQEQQYGSVQELPAVQLLGAHDVPWRCVGAVLFRMQQAGFARLLFGAPGAQQIVVDLPITIVPPPPPPPIMPQINWVGVATDGHLSWNGARLPAERVSEFLRQTIATRPMPELAVDPSPEARLETVIGLLRLIRDAGVATSRLDLDGRRGGSAVAVAPDRADRELPLVLDDIAFAMIGFVGLDRFANELK